MTSQKWSEKLKSGKNKIFVFGAILFADDDEGHIETCIRVTNLNIVGDIISGKMRGLSPDMKIRWWECSICHKDFERCLHKEGKLYAGKTCHPLAKGVEASGGSIVAQPKDPRARITDLLIVEDNKKDRYTWFGFPTVHEDQRFKHIQGALASKHISEKAAFHFGRFFSVNVVGKTTYPS